MGSTATPEGALGYVREFTRHSSDVLGNLNELRLRGILTDVTLLVGGQPLRAHKAVLIACSGFFYSIFRGRAGVGVDVLSLPGGPEAGGFAPLLDFMYTSRLRLSPATAPAVLAAATYLQMEHVVQACHRFIQASYEPLSISLRPLEAEPPRPPTAPPPGSPRRSEGHPDPPTESRSCSQGPPSPGSPDPKACNWKKYKFIVLNSQASQAGSLAGERSSGQLCSQARLPSGDEASSSSSSGSEEGPIPGPQSRLSPTAANVQFKYGAPVNTPHLLTPRAPEPTGSPSGQARPPPGSEFFNCQNCEAVAGCSSGLDPLAPGEEDKPYKCQLCRSAFRYKGNLASHRTVHTGEKPYHCSICGARFNRPANLKTHSRIHSGEKPYKCETCGSRFVQVAHLRAHVLIHTGEKPYPCPTCGTRFRHLQTLKSHVRIHTGEKPYHAWTLDSRPAEPRPPALNAGGQCRPGLPTYIASPPSPPPGERRRRLTQPLCSFQALIGTFLSTILSSSARPRAVRLGGWMGGPRWNILSPAPGGALSGGSPVTSQMAHKAEPPDGGWGWMVVLSAFFQSALVFGVLRSFGVFFVEFVAAFEEQAARVSWIASIGIAVQQFGSPVGSALSTKFGPRPVVMAGGILAALGMLLASFATSLTHLYLSIGLLSGSGWALTFTPTLACLSRYFSRRRSLATGLALTGVGLSSFAFAPLFQWLLSYYAWRGALLLVSALSLHLVACGALLRPLSLAEDPAVGGPGTQLTSLLHHGPFLRYTVALTLINTGYFIPYVHLVAHLQDLDWDPLPAAFLLSVVAISDLVGRVASGWLGDAVPGPVARLLMLWTTLTGVILALFPVALAPTALVALAVAYGFTSGALTPVAFSVLPELVGTGKIYCGLGLVQMVESIGGLLGAPLSGYLRDVTGNYTASFVVSGAFLLAGSGVLITLPHFFCFSAPTSKPQDLVTETLGTKVPLPSEGLGEE